MTGARAGGRGPADELGVAVAPPGYDLRAVLRIAPFRRLWITLGLSSLGDWLGLLALTVMASQLAGASYRAENFAIAGVLLLRLLPAALAGPIGGYVADRLDRRWTLVVGDVLRFALFASIPLVGTLPWLFVATVLLEAVSLVWLPAKDAAVPNLVPRERLAVANQLSLITTYGSALPAAALFTLLALVNKSLTVTLHLFDTSVDLAMYFNAATFLVGAAVVATLREVSTRPGRQEQPQENAIRSILDGWAFVGRNRLVRGLVFGILGAFGAGGAVIGLGRTYVGDLGGGTAGYGVLFGAVFTGLAIGMGVGPRLLTGFSRRRLFGLAIVAAGLALGAVALIPNIVVVSFATVLLGLFAGIVWVTGYTLLGLEVGDDLRGRTFGFVNAATRLVLSGVLAVAPAVAGAIGAHRLDLPYEVELTYNGAALTFLLAAIVAVLVGVTSYRHMDDRRGVPLLRDLRAALAGHGRGVYADQGLFIAFEGGEGAGKSTQAARLHEWLRTRGYAGVLTREPGATPVGAKLRQLLLDPATGSLAPRSEALLYAADRAEHLDRVVLPALRRGEDVETDRYVDSSLAYQGGGRDLGRDEIARLSRWATRGLRPHLTVLLDLPVSAAAARRGGEPADRLERESAAFHERVRRQFLELAELDPDRYLVLDATRAPEALAEAIRDRVRPLLGRVRRADTRPADGAPDAAAPPDQADQADQAGQVGGVGAGGATGATDRDPASHAAGPTGHSTATAVHAAGPADRAAGPAEHAAGSDRALPGAPDERPAEGAARSAEPAAPALHRGAR